MLRMLFQFCYRTIYCCDAAPLSSHGFGYVLIVAGWMRFYTTLTQNIPPKMLSFEHFDYYNAIYMDNHLLTQPNEKPKLYTIII